MPITISGSTGIAGVDGSASTPAVQGTDTNTGIVFPAADTVAVATGGTERLRIDSSGNVGIGTSSPASLLQVTGTVRFGAGPSDATNASVAAYSDGAGISIEAFQGNASGTKRNMWLNAYGGNVGIGTTTPGSLLTVNGNLAFNSGYGSAATAYGCRAWVNFNGTGTVAIRASGNVTSITDNGTGDYTVNFTNAMPDANYSSVGACAKNDGNNDGNQTAQVGGFSGSLQTASACRIRTVYITGFSAQDSPQVTFAAFR